MLRALWDRGPIYPPWGPTVPELTAHELKILTRPRLGVWPGILLMVLNAGMEFVPTRPGSQWVHWTIQPAMCLFGLVWAWVGYTFEVEREKVMRSVRAAAMKGKAEGQGKAEGR